MFSKYRIGITLGLLCVALLQRSPARAAGVEDLIGGAVGTGRAANYGRVSDFMAISLNPANLAAMPGINAGFEARVPVLRGCFDRFYDPTVEYKQPGIQPGFNGSESLAEVCNQAKPVLAGNIGFIQGFRKGWGYGIGIFTPAAAGSSRYGNSTIVTLEPNPLEQYTPTTSGVQNPARQMGIAREGVTAFLTAGVGVRLSRMLRVGGSVGYGVASIYSRSVVSVIGGTFRDQEVMNEIRANSWFVPRATASFVFSPSESFDIFGVLHYQGDIVAKGTADLTANGIKGAPRKDCGDPDRGTHCRINGIEITVPFPTFEAVLGMRYAKLRRGRKGTLDPMRDEKFDIELEAIWSQTSAVDAFKVKLHDLPTTDPNVPRVQFGNFEGASSSFIRQTTQIPKNWNDTLSIRLGTDIQLVPERFAIRAGGSYASRATPLEYMSIDYWPVQKIGAHVGATLAVSHMKFTFGYAHFFYQPATVMVGTGGVKEIATLEEARANAVNEGTYRAMQDVFSLQVDAAF